jgi:hypothetical protein
MRGISWRIPPGLHPKTRRGLGDDDGDDDVRKEEALAGGALQCSAIQYKTAKRREQQKKGQHSPVSSARTLEGCVCTV